MVLGIYISKERIEGNEYIYDPNSRLLLKYEETKPYELMNLRKY